VLPTNNPFSNVFAFQVFLIEEEEAGQVAVAS
jgi:hypothetical protein